MDPDTVGRVLAVGCTSFCSVPPDITTLRIAICLPTLVLVPRLQFWVRNHCPGDRTPLTMEPDTKLPQLRLPKTKCVIPPSHRCAYPHTQRGVSSSREHSSRNQSTASLLYPADVYPSSPSSRPTDDRSPPATHSSKCSASGEQASSFRIRKCLIWTLSLYKNRI